MYQAQEGKVFNSSQVCQAVYVSTATEPIRAECVRQIIEISKGRNAMLGITGILLYANERFLGTLEGPKWAVQDTIDRVRTDYRHKNFDMLRFEYGTGRLFKDWQMSLQDFAELENLPSLSPFLNASFDPVDYREQPNAIFRAMLAFRRQHEATTET